MSQLKFEFEKYTPSNQPLIPRDWITWLLFFLALANVFFINYFSVNIPYWDEWWFFVRGAHTTALDWNHLLVPHNEHFILPTKFVTVSLYKLGALNFRTLIFIHQILWLGFLVYFYWFLYRLNLLNKWVRLSFLFFLSTITSENQTMGFQSCFPFFLIFSLASVDFALVQASRLRNVLLFSLLLVLNTFTLSTGVIAGFAVLLVYLWDQFRSKEFPTKWKKAFYLALPSLAWLIGATHFFKVIIEQKQSAFVNTLPYKFEFWNYFAGLVSYGLGATPVFLNFLALIPLFVFALLVAQAFKEPKDPRFKSLIAIGLVVFAAFAAIAYGRASMGVAQSKSSRYAAIALLLLPMIFSTLKMISPASVLRKRFEVGLFILCLGLNLRYFDFGAYPRIYDDRRQGVACMVDYFNGLHRGDCPLIFHDNLKPYFEEARRLNISFTQNLPINPQPKSSPERTPQFQKVVIDNANPRRDINSNIVDAHDGCLKYFEGKYYLYGTKYGKTDGWGTTNKFVAYSSPNLKDWLYEGEILTGLPARVHFRPYVIYNKSTRKYVLWYNRDRQLAVATADRPEGPFTMVNDNVKLQNSDLGDLGLFVDDDGTAYITYSYGPISAFEVREEPIPHHQIAVEKLSPDYLGSAGLVTGPIAGNVESPTLFRRKDTYYLLFDNTCAFCEAGTGVRVYTAKKPLGPFTYRGNVNIPLSASSSWTQPGTGRENAIIKAQQTHVAVLPGAKENVYIWMGDRWGSRHDGIKGHDFQHWEVMSFDSHGMIQRFQNRPEWTIEIPVL